MTISDETFWGVVASMGGLIGWLLSLERKLNARLTRKEHSDICDKANMALSKKLDTITDKLDKQDDAAAKDRQTTLEHRQWVGDSLATIRTQIAVLKVLVPKRGRADPSDEELGRKNE